MRKFSVEDGYKVEDMLLFGFGHVNAARALFGSNNSEFLDSAGYLAHLGIELLLKSCHLYRFGYFVDSHKLVTLYEKLYNDDHSRGIGAEYKKFLLELDAFYFLRYPQSKKPVEVGSDQLERFDEVIDALWQVFPEELIEIFHGLDHIEKGRRVLMVKEVDDAANEDKRMKTLTVPVSDAAEELLRREAEHTGQSIEQIVGEMIEADARRRAQQRLVRELDEGLEAAKQGRVVTIDAGQLTNHIAQRYRARSQD